MKNLFFFLFLFITKIVFAQSFYAGGTFIGLLEYQLRQEPVYNNNDSPVDIFGQYIFKNSRLGGEVDLLIYAKGLPSNSGVTNANFTNANYVVYSLLHKPGTIQLQLKAGLFYSRFITFNNTFDDVGPALGAELMLPITKKIYVGFDLTEMVGTNNKYDPNVFEYPVLQNTTQVSYTCYLIKLIWHISK